MLSSNNKELASDVESALKTQIDLQIDELSVKAEDGVITLYGIAHTTETRMKAAEYVRRIPGVKEIFNELRLHGEESHSVKDYLEDSLITAEVKARLLKEEGLTSLKVHVETHEGIVTLTGETDSEEGLKLAERVAYTPSGVREVTNRLTIVP